jgi:hypothetical protein
MRSPRITEENMANQISVVKEEIRVNVLNRPYGGFPWLVLPPVLFDTFPNAHNGYGGFEDLQNATATDATRPSRRSSTTSAASADAKNQFGLTSASRSRGGNVVRW